MRLLIATGLYPPESGGPATYAKLLEERLPAHGIPVSVLPFSKVRSLPPGIRHVAYFFWCLRKGREADMLFAQDTVSVGLPAALAALLLGKKFLVRIPGDYAWEQGRARFGITDTLDEFQTRRYGWRVEALRTMQRFVLESATRVIVPSKYLGRIASHWVEDARISVIYNGIDTHIKTEAPHGRPEGFLIVSHGRRVPWKGFESLERVAAREDDWSLYIAPPMTRAQVLGWVETADVFVNSSTYEGLSHALLEAMVLGTPIVATAVGGNPELIESGKTGLLVPPSDDETLYRAIKSIAADPVAARARAAAAKERVKDFSIERTVGQVAELLQTL